jgi:hypothetical protein
LGRGLIPATLALAFVTACGPLPPAPAAGPDAVRPPAAPRTRLAEPAANEVVVVINNNAAGGTHSGMFAGTRLSDPSGSYVAERSRDASWPGPSLDDYVRFQLEDGEDVRVYRFRLDQRDFARIDERLRNEGPTAPLFCAAAVQNHLAGVGPFAGIPRVWWTTPSALAERLDALALGRAQAGVCLRPAGEPC